MQKNEVLVLSATGVQGSAVARELLQAGHAVRALTRRLGHPTAESLRLRGARLAWAEPDDDAALRDAVAGVDVIFAVTSAAYGGVAAETRRGLALVELAKRHDVQHIVYSSAMAAASLSGVPHYDSKHEIEQYLHASGVPHTILCPGFLMENLLRGYWVEHLRQGRLPVPLSPGHRLQQVAASDVARFVRLVLHRPEEFLGRRVCLASDEATGIEMAAVLARVLGRRIAVVQPHGSDGPPAPWTLEAFAWLDRHAGCAHVSLLRSRYPEVNWHTLDGWAQRQDWSALGR